MDGSTSDIVRPGSGEPDIVRSERMPESQPFELEAAAGERIQGILDLPDHPGLLPAVVVCHGFKGFMEWGFFPSLAALLAARGFVVARFNFSGSGMRPGDELVTDVEAFYNATFSKDVAEVRAVTEALPGHLAPGRVDPERLGLFGHSRGGGAAILSAAGMENSVKSLVTWAAVANFDRVAAGEKETWRQKGELPIVNARTNQELALGVRVLDDLERHSDQLDIVAAAERLELPWLIVHGGQDETVPVSEGRNLAAKAGAASNLLEIASGGHTFGAVHPFAGPTPQLIEAMNATQNWFRRHLGSPESN